MKAIRLLVKVAFVALAVWLLQPVLEAYNTVILNWFNFLLDDSLVNRMTFEAVEAVHAEVFGPIVLPRLILLVLLIVVTWVVLRLFRSTARSS